MKRAQPPILSCSENLDFSTFDAVAIPASGSTSASAQFPKGAANSPASASIKLIKEFELEGIFEEWPAFTGKAGELIEIPVDFKKLKRIYVVGIGESSQEDLRKAAIALGRKTKGNEVKVLNLLITSSKSAVVHLNALSLSHYTFSMKSAADSIKKRSTFVHVDTLQSEVDYASTLVEAVWRARDLIHTPSNIKDPGYIASQVSASIKKIASPALTVKVHAGRDLAKFGGLVAVGGSAPKPGPRMIEIKYAPKGSASWPHVVLVGKGITFDTGGISLKRGWENMAPMKTDMSGAAVIMSTAMAMVDIKPKVRVTALMMCAENMASRTAQRPSDVITHYDGTTVEVLDTDAEGRLVLADGLAYANLHLNPDYLIDVATLTAAATLGLGKQYVAMYTRDFKLAAKLQKRSEEIADRVWHMPLVDDYSEALESDIADYAHISKRKRFSGGSITAALFLEKFVGGRNWLHFDIAGPARSELDAGENIKGGTAPTVRLFIDWIKSL